MRHPAALPGLAIPAGVLTGIFLELDIPHFVPALVAAAACAAHVARRDAAASFLLLCGFFAAGIWLGRHADFESRHTPLDAFFEDAAGQEHQVFALLEGRLRADAVRGPAGVTLSVLIERLRIDGVRHHAPGGALIGIGGEVDAEQILQWRAGRRVAFPATLRRPTVYRNLGVPDMRVQLERRGITLVGSVKSGRLITVVQDAPALEEMAASFRGRVRQAVAARVGRWSDQSGAVVNAILIGDRTALSDETERRLQEAGTYHVIAISGGNIAILAAILAGMMTLARAGTATAAASIIAMLSAYAMVVDGGSSVQRATAMAIVYFSGRMFDRSTTPANAVCTASAGLVVVQPLHAVDVGFALSFGATVAIVAGIRAVTERLAIRPWLRVPAALVAGSICAEAALLPISASIFSRVTFAGLLANAAAIPLMTIIQAAGMVVVALHRPVPLIASWAGWMAHCSVEGLIGSAAVVDVLPWLTRRVAPPPLLVSALYYAAIVSAAAALYVVSSPRRRICRLSWAAAACCAAWIVTAPRPLVSSRLPLRVSFLDVGQGDAAVVEFPSGHVLTVDAGGAQGSSFDIGSRVVSPALWALGIRRVDFMSVTHGDIDHIGGALSLFRDFRPREVWEGVPVPPHKPTQQLRVLAGEHRAVWRTLQAGDRGHFGGADLIVRHPPLPEWERQRVRNDDSQVFEVRLGRVSFVLTGDIGREVERAIAGGFDRAAIRIVKVPHHGSASSSTPAFLTALDPDIVVFSAGRGNPFGHPAPSVVDRYRAGGAALYRTDRDGQITIETDGVRVQVRTFTGRMLTLTTRGR